MGEAFVTSLLKRGITDAGSLMVSDVDATRLGALSASYGIQVTSDNHQAAKHAESMILAVKPQVLNEVLQGLKGVLLPGQLVVSIVAGATLRTLAQGLAHGGVIRAMPNTPAQIGEGITVWTAAAEVESGGKEIGKSILAALGKEIYVQEEKYLDMATAVSGSGPAYVFMLIEAFTDAAVHIGIPRSIAQELVLQTMVGSSLFAQRSAKHPAELRNMVSTPGGTTVEGLFWLEEAGLRAAFARGVKAAYEKSRILGGETLK